MAGSAGKSVEASIPYYEGPFHPPGLISSLTTTCYSRWESVNIIDARPAFSSYTLDKNGFQYVKHSSALSHPPYTLDSWKDHTIREQVNDVEVAELAKKVTGAKKIMILLATGRNAAYIDPVDAPSRHDTYSDLNKPLPSTRAKGFYDGLDMGPIRKPHIDWGPDGVRQILREWSHDLAIEARDIIEAEDQAARLPGGIANNYNGRRWGLYNTWRPLRQVRKDPLACVDFYSSRDDKCFIYWRDIPGINGPFRADVLLTPANPKHEWYWLSDQQSDEILFMRIFDSEQERNPDSVAGGVHHCSFHLPGSDDEEVRFSVETKFMAFW